MSKPKVHIIVECGKSACGIVPVYNNHYIKSYITCPKCKKTEAYKNLRSK